MNTSIDRGGSWHPLIELALARLREFAREPEAIFWAFIFPILMSVTLISSIYGMNFTYMPELGTRFGYVGALTAMLVVGIAIYLYFRKIKWL